MRIHYWRTTGDLPTHFRRCAARVDPLCGPPGHAYRICKLGRERKRGRILASALIAYSSLSTSRVGGARATLKTKGGAFVDREQEIQTLHRAVCYPVLWRFRYSLALAIERVRGRRRVAGLYTLVHCVRPHPRSRRLRSPHEACLVQSRNNTGYMG
jgi:hypothetical protein